MGMGRHRRPGRHWVMSALNRTRARAKGFSLIELVIVVVIIAIIGAIAIPRLSRGSAGAADSALGGNLRVLRSVTDLYATEHAGRVLLLTVPPYRLTHYSNDVLPFHARQSPHSP